MIDDVTREMFDVQWNPNPFVNRSVIDRLTSHAVL